MVHFRSISGGSKIGGMESESEPHNVENYVDRSLTGPSAAYVE